MSSSNAASNATPAPGAASLYLWAHQLRKEHKVLENKIAVAETIIKSLEDQIKAVQTSTGVEDTTTENAEKLEQLETRLSIIEAERDDFLQEVAKGAAETMVGTAQRVTAEFIEEHGLPEGKEFERIYKKMLQLSRESEARHKAQMEEAAKHQFLVRKVNSSTEELVRRMDEMQKTMDQKWAVIKTDAYKVESMKAMVEDMLAKVTGMSEDLETRATQLKVEIGQAALQSALLHQTQTRASQSTEDSDATMSDVNMTEAKAAEITTAPKAGKKTAETKATETNGTKAEVLDIYNFPRLAYSQANYDDLGDYFVATIVPAEKEPRRFELFHVEAFLRGLTEDAQRKSLQMSLDKRGWNWDTVALWMKITFRTMHGAKATPKLPAVDCFNQLVGEMSISAGAAANSDVAETASTTTTDTKANKKANKKRNKKNKRHIDVAPADDDNSAASSSAIDRAIGGALTLADNGQGGLTGGGPIDPSMMRAVQAAQSARAMAMANLKKNRGE